MTAKEWLEVMKQAENYNPAMTSLIDKYGELFAQQECIAFGMSKMMFWNGKKTIAVKLSQPISCINNTYFQNQKAND